MVRHEPPRVQGQAKRCASAEGFGARELEAEEIAGRRHVGQCCPERPFGKAVTTPQDKRAAAIKAMKRHDISQRRACRLVSVDPKTVSRTKEPDNQDIRVKMRAIAEQSRRFGYRRIRLMVEREGIMMNHKKLRRIYGEEGLSVKRRRGRKRALGTRAPVLEPSGPSTGGASILSRTALETADGSVCWR